MLTVLINGYVKQHGSHFSHPPYPSFMNKAKLVCSAGLRISAGHWDVEAMETEPKRLFQRAIVDFIYKYLPMFLLLILKSFLRDCMSSAGVPGATDPGNQSTELQGRNSPLHRGSVGLLEKNYKCGTGLLLPVVRTISTSAPKPILQNPEHLKLIKHLRSLCHQAANTRELWEYAAWDIQP